MTPGVMTYTAIMDNYIAENKLDSALDWYGKMLEKGIKPTVGSYNSLITIHGMKKDLQKVLDIFVEMEKTGVRINKTSYEVYIAALLRCGEVDRARDQFTRMRKDAVKPDEEMLYSVMHEYAKKNDTNQVSRGLLFFYFCLL